MNAVPLALKRAIGAGIGLFILFIGFANGGLIVSGCSPFVPLPSAPARSSRCRSRRPPPSSSSCSAWRSRSSCGRARSRRPWSSRSSARRSSPSRPAWPQIPDNLTLDAELLDARRIRPDATSSASLAAADGDPRDLRDHAHRLLRHDGHGHRRRRRGRARRARTAPCRASGACCSSTALAAAVGGLAGVSSNTTYIESAAGVAEGAKTGFASVVTGVLFLLAILLAPLAGIIPGVATAPALVLVGYLMFTQVKDINVGDVEDGLPALLTMILMPLTYDITVGIGAGFISWVRPPARPASGTRG